MNDLPCISLFVSVDIIVCSEGRKSQVGLNASFLLLSLARCYGDRRALSLWDLIGQLFV